MSTFTACFLDKIDVRMDGNIISNCEVLLRINLRRPIHFDYQIEFFDVSGGILSTMEGEKGKQTFQHTVSLRKDTELMAHFRIGEVTGPDSDAVIVDVTEGMLIVTHVQPFFYKVPIMIACCFSYSF